MPQYDQVAPKVYVNLQDQGIFAVIDPATDEVVGCYPVGRCKGNHGMTVDPEHHRAFLACESNELMTVFNLDTKQPIAFLPLPDGPDVIKFDPGLKRIYVACSSGAISVFQMDDPDHFCRLKRSMQHPSDHLIWQYVSSGPTLGVAVRLYLNRTPFLCFYASG